MWFHAKPRKPHRLFQRDKNSEGEGKGGRGKEEKGREAKEVEEQKVGAKTVKIETGWVGEGGYIAESKWPPWDALVRSAALAESRLVVGDGWVGTRSHFTSLGGIEHDLLGQEPDEEERRRVKENYEKYPRQ